MTREKQPLLPVFFLENEERFWLQKKEIVAASKVIIT